MIPVVTDKAKAAQIIRLGADHIATFGHHTGDFAPKDRCQDPTAPTCAAGAINLVTFGAASCSVVPDEAFVAGVGANTAAKLALVDVLGLAPIEVEEGGSPPDYDVDELLASWNDPRDAETVVADMRRVAAQLEQTSPPA